ERRVARAVALDGGGCHGSSSARLACIADTDRGPRGLPRPFARLSATFPYAWPPDERVVQSQGPAVRPVRRADRRRPRRGPAARPPGAPGVGRPGRAPGGGGGPRGG